MAKKEKLRGKDVEALGYNDTALRSLAMQLIARAAKHESVETQLNTLAALLATPEKYKQDKILSPLALKLIDLKMVGEQPTDNSRFEQYQGEKKVAIFGAEGIDLETEKQMQRAMELPVSVAGALMPDAHYGYGLPIGGVLATENSVIPYGVGVDIACRMCLTVYELDKSGDIFIEKQREELRKTLMNCTRFGEDTFSDNFREDAVIDSAAFNQSSFLKRWQDKAYTQIGSSGGGNHFVDLGVLALPEKNRWHLNEGRYFAILSHSGSRGLGAQIAEHYKQIAIKKRGLSKEQAYMSWLGLDEVEGAAYWAAMHLAGDYASACHHHIHKRIAKALNIQPAFMVENHHNFAWKEQHKGRELIVHRKGATPAAAGELGIIPGSMASPAFLVEGRGNADALKSAAHGAGRLMSRRQALQTYNSKMMRAELNKHGVELMGGGVDEAPFVYKNIEEVMQAQNELVNILGVFSPKLVRMAADTKD